MQSDTQTTGLNGTSLFPITTPTRMTRVGKLLGEKWPTVLTPNGRELKRLMIVAIDKPKPGELDALWLDANVGYIIFTDGKFTRIESRGVISLAGVSMPSEEWKEEIDPQYDSVRLVCINKTLALAELPEMLKTAILSARNSSGKGDKKPGDRTLEQQLREANAELSQIDKSLLDNERQRELLTRERTSVEDRIRKLNEAIEAARSTKKREEDERKQEENRKRNLFATGLETEATRLGMDALGWLEQAEALDKPEIGKIAKTRAQLEILQGLLDSGEDASTNDGCVAVQKRIDGMVAEVLRLRERAKELEKQAETLCTDAKDIREGRKPIPEAPKPALVEAAPAAAEHATNVVVETSAAPQPPTTPAADPKTAAGTASTTSPSTAPPANGTVEMGEEDVVPVTFGPNTVHLRIREIPTPDEVGITFGSAIIGPELDGVEVVSSLLKYTDVLILQRSRLFFTSPGVAIAVNHRPGLVPDVKGIKKLLEACVSDPRNRLPKGSNVAVPGTSRTRRESGIEFSEYVFYVNAPLLIGGTVPITSAQVCEFLIRRVSLFVWDARVKNAILSQRRTSGMESARRLSELGSTRTDRREAARSAQTGSQRTNPRGGVNYLEVARQLAAKTATSAEAPVETSNAT